MSCVVQTKLACKQGRRYAMPAPPECAACFKEYKDLKAERRRLKIEIAELKGLQPPEFADEDEDEDYGEELVHKSKPAKSRKTTPKASKPRKAAKSSKTTPTASTPRKPSNTPKKASKPGTAGSMTEKQLQRALLRVQNQHVDLWNRGFFASANEFRLSLMFDFLYVIVAANQRPSQAFLQKMLKISLGPLGFSSAGIAQTIAQLSARIATK